MIRTKQLIMDSHTYLKGGKISLCLNYNFVGKIIKTTLEQTKSEKHSNQKQPNELKQNPNNPVNRYHRSFLNPNIPFVKPESMRMQADMID